MCNFHRKRSYVYIQDIFQVAFQEQMPNPVNPSTPKKPQPQCVFYDVSPPNVDSASGCCYIVHAVSSYCETFKSRHTLMVVYLFVNARVFICSTVIGRLWADGIDQRS
jgi:hypothetical protein